MPITGYIPCIAVAWIVGAAGGSPAGLDDELLAPEHRVADELLHADRELTLRHGRRACSTEKRPWRRSHASRKAVHSRGPDMARSGGTFLAPPEHFRESERVCENPRRLFAAVLRSLEEHQRSRFFEVHVRLRSKNLRLGQK